jgi:hypothetical protein
MPNGRQHIFRSKCSPPTHRSGVLHAAIPPHAYLRSYRVSPRHSISSNLLTTFLSLVSRSTFRELGCLHPTTSVPCLVIFVFSEKRIGGVCSYAHCLRARKAPRQQLRQGVCCAHSPASTCSRSARLVSPAVPPVSKFARKALPTSKGCAQVHCLGGRLCLLGGGFWGGWGGR